MINWFAYIAFLLPVLWALGIFLHLRNNNKVGLTIISGATVLFAVYIAVYWVQIGRAPFKTLGETRLWYALFLPIIGMVIYYRWKLFWMIVYSHSLAIVFLLINVLKPDNFDKTLMPALQSYWFVPHVIVYIFAYALLAASTLFAVKGLWDLKQNKFNNSIMHPADNLVYFGFAFLTFGLLFGALWAKEAWGHYWTWDPKETWAFVTWLTYLIYIHIRFRHPKNVKAALWILALAMLFLLICWFGINYLPSAQNSVHVYGAS